MEVANKYELPRGYLSASAIDTLLKCPKQYEFRYVNGYISPANSALALGSITHRAFQSYYTDVLQSATHERLTGSQAVELTMDLIMPEWFQENEVDVKPAEKKDIEETVPDIVEKYVDRVGSYITPVGVEQEVDFTMECGVPIKGYLDLVRDKGDNNTGIVDYKISGKAWSLSRLQNSLQFMIYSYATGIHDIQIQNIVKPAAGRKLVVNDKYAQQDKESSGTYSFTAGSGMNILGHSFDENGQYLEDLVRSCAELITIGVFTPTQPGNWWCTPKWCDFWYLCRGRKV